MGRSGGWLSVGEKPFPPDGSDIFVIDSDWGPNVAVIENGRPQVWDLQCGSQTHDALDTVILWRPVPDGYEQS